MRNSSNLFPFFPYLFSRFSHGLQDLENDIYNLLAYALETGVSSRDVPVRTMILFIWPTTGNRGRRDATQKGVNFIGYSE